MSITKSGFHNIGINSISLQNHKNSIAQSNSTVVKNQIRYNNVKSQNTSKAVNINYNIHKHIENLKNSKCVNNLNLIACHADKLSSEKIQPLYNKSSPIVRNNMQSVSHNERENDKNNKNDSSKTNEQLNSQHFDKYYTKLLTKMYEYLINNDYCETFKIIVIYKEIDGTELIEKQLITAIPFIENQPQRSISEIAVIAKSGEIKKYSMPVYLHIGGYTYTNDWLSISSVAFDRFNMLQKIYIEYEQSRINGFCINYDSTEKSNCIIASHMKLHIPGFSNIWE
jgi:hypothetical protein